MAYNSQQVAFIPFLKGAIPVYSISQTMRKGKRKTSGQDFEICENVRDTALVAL